MKFSAFKYRNKFFQLEVGDIFYHNGISINYYPAGSENKSKLPTGGGYFYYPKSMPLPKAFHKAFMLCENKEEIGTPEGYKEHVKRWKITEVDKIEIVESTQKIYYVGISKQPSKKRFFHIAEGSVKKETEKQFLMAKNFRYQSRILKSDFNVVRSPPRYGTNFVGYLDSFAVLCRFNDLDKYRDLLYAMEKEKLLKRVQQAKEELKTFKEISKENGY